MNDTKPTLFEHIKGLLLLALEWIIFGFMTFVGWKIGSLLYIATLSKFDIMTQIIVFIWMIISLVWFNKKYKK